MAALGLRDVALQHGPAYVARHARLLPSHKAALYAISTCRTPALGGHLARCDDCGTERVLLNSCRHRACPQCGHAATQRWLARQRQLLLPVRYFHVVFTIPDELRRPFRTHQRTLLDVLFRSAFAALASVCAEHLGFAQIGALAVLHTWTRTLEWHPHVHMLVPGGGLAADGRTWRTVVVRRPTSKVAGRKPYLVPVKKLSAAFRRILLVAAKRAAPDAMRDIETPAQWVVFTKPAVCGAEKVLEYLGRYVHRTALGNSAITTLDDRSVTFRYRRSDDGSRRTMRLPPDEFLRRYLQHVMPRGFHRVRLFGLLHPSQRPTLRRLQLLLSSRPRHVDTPPDASPLRHPLRCPTCGHDAVRVLYTLTPAQCLELSRALEPKGLSP